MASKTVLIITASGGSGHLKAARAIREKLLAADPEMTVIERNIFSDWLGNYFGRFCSYLWNRAQSSGDIAQINRLVAMQPIANILFWPPFFMATVHCLYKYRPEEVIDTQPLGTSAIIRAIRFVRHLCPYSTLYKKVLTELPTPEAIHFFSPIKKMSATSRQYLTLISLPPLLESEATEQEFWTKYASLPLKSIKHTGIPISKTLLKLQKHVTAKDITSIPLRNPSLKEAKALHKFCTMQKLSPILENTTLHIPLPDNAKVLILMLGGFPEREALYEYTKSLLKLSANCTKNTPPIYLFVFCNQAKATNCALQAGIEHLVTTSKSTPLKVIPMGYQEEETMGRLFIKCSASITRSGGMTSMELLNLTSGHIWIHKIPQQPHRQEHDGMPRWEKGNAEYLRHKKNAQYIDPSLVRDVCPVLFSP